MNLANKLTFLRLVLAPVFFIIYLVSGFFPTLSIWALPVLWIIFVAALVSDLLDGMAARKLNETSDFGKFFDPFADTLMQVTCLLCFVVGGLWAEFGILPAILILLVLYREFGILFLRNLMLKKGVAMGARAGGKIKTVFYVVTVGFALLATSLQRLDMEIFNFLIPYFTVAALVLFIISVIISIVSFFDYFSVYKKTASKGSIMLI